MDAKEKVGKALQHVGVKGMRWGVRRRSGGPRKGSVTRRAARRLADESAAKKRKKELDAAERDDISITLSRRKKVGQARTRKALASIKKFYKEERDRTTPESIARERRQGQIAAATALVLIGGVLMRK